MNAIPISTLFIGINGLIAFALSYIVALEPAQEVVCVQNAESGVYLPAFPLLDTYKLPVVK